LMHLMIQTRKMKKATISGVPKLSMMNSFAHCLARNDGRLRADAYSESVNENRNKGWREASPLLSLPRFGDRLNLQS
jgi:hypothetical protein